MLSLIPPVFWVAVAFILGLIFGSFFNVCIYRIPLKQSIINPPSHCPSCNYQIRWFDNIPIISYVLLLGKCRKCRSKISFRYPVVEVLTGILFALTIFYYGLTIYSLIILLMISAVIIMSFIDIDHFLLPNRFTLSLIPLGVLSTFFTDRFDWTDSLLGIAAGAGVILLFSGGYYFIKKTAGMGGGDVKLMAGVGAFLGPKLALLTILLGTFSGLIVMLPFLIMKRKNMDSMLPFGPFLAFSAVVCLFWGDQIFDWWMKHPVFETRLD